MFILYRIYLYIIYGMYISCMIYVYIHIICLYMCVGIYIYAFTLSAWNNPALQLFSLLLAHVIAIYCIKFMGNS